MPLDFMKCPKCDSHTVLHNSVEDADSDGATISAECGDCGAEITYSLKVVDAEYEGQYDEQDNGK